MARKGIQRRENPRSIRACLALLFVKVLISTECENTGNRWSRKDLNGSVLLGERINDKRGHDEWQEGGFWILSHSYTVPDGVQFATIPFLNSRERNNRGSWNSVFQRKRIWTMKWFLLYSLVAMTIVSCVRSRVNGRVVLGSWGFCARSEGEMGVRWGN